VVIPSVGANLNKININYLFMSALYFGSIVLSLNFYNSCSSPTLSVKKFNTLYKKEYKAVINPN
jgi:hypothetical protein